MGSEQSRERAASCRGASADLRDRTPILATAAARRRCPTGAPTLLRFGPLSSIVLEVRSRERGGAQERYSTRHQPHRQFFGCTDFQHLPARLTHVYGIWT